MIQSFIQKITPNPEKEPVSYETLLLRAFSFPLYMTGQWL